MDLLVVIHQITEAVQHNHRLAAARAALKDEAFPFGTGDDLVLLFLDRFDDVLDRGFFLAVFDDFPKIGIEKNFLVPSPDLLVRQIFPHGKKFVFEIEHLPVFCAQRAAKNGFIIVFVNRKGNAALLVISSGQRRTPIDNLQLYVAFLADVIAVISLERIGEIHARKIGFVEKTSIGIDGVFMLADLFQQFRHFAVIFRVMLLFPFEPGDFPFRGQNLHLMLADMPKFQHAHHRGHVLAFVGILFFRIQKLEKPRLIRLFMRIEYAY